MPEPAILWRDIHFALPVKPEQSVRVLRRFATMAGSPRLVLEADGRAGRLSWRVGGSETALRRVAAMFAIEAPGSILASSSVRRVPAAAAAKLLIRRHRERPVASERTEDVARAVLAALSAAGPGDLVRLQLILGERLHPIPAPLPIQPARGESERRRLMASKTGEHGFGCAIRLGVSAPSPQLERELLGGVLAALRSIEAPGQRIQLRRTRVAAMSMASSPWLWPLRLSVTDLPALLGWPIGELPLPGVAAAHPKPVRAVETVATSGRLLGNNDVAGTSRPMALSVADSLRHAALIGPTGTGKSVLIARLALQDMAVGRSVVVIDPKGDLVKDLICRVPAHRQDDAVVLDGTDEAPVGLNPLVGQQRELAADGLVAVCRDLYADSWGPRTQDILHASLLSLAKRGDGSLVLVPLLLTNSGFRRSVVGRVTKADPMGLGSFWAWFESISDAERATAIAPLMNKLRPILLRPGLRAMLGQTNPKFDLREVFTARRIVLINLAKGELGADAARLLGSMVVSLLWQRALERSHLPASRRHPVMVFIDEVADYLRLPTDLGEALAQARGLGVGYTLATQHLRQLPPALRAALQANARSKVCFQLSHEDAVVMARGSDLSPEDFTSLPSFQAYASLLSSNTPTPYASLSTQPLSEPTGKAADIRRRSRERYGRPLSDVEAAWAEFASQPAHDGPVGRVRLDRPGGAA